MANTFYMLVGPAGSGKSTVARELGLLKWQNGVIHSSDKLREELWGDASIQYRSDIVFDVMNYRVKRDFAAGKDVIYDATNLSRHNRALMLRALKAIPGEHYYICLVMNTTESICISRDLMRERSVGEEVIKRQFNIFEAPFMSEGWDDIHLVNDEYMEKLFEAVDKALPF